MAAPTLDSDHPGLKVVAAVAAVLADGLASEEALGRAIGAMRPGVALTRCRLWLRPPEGASSSPLTPPGDEPPPPGAAPPPAEGFRAGPPQERTPQGTLLRLPLVHEDEALGVLEVIIPVGRLAGVAHDVAVVVAQILAPVIAATELSQDLASEVALRTREVEAQRNFAARIIDSLPVGDRKSVV